jgi:hypothetical protein
MSKKSRDQRKKQSKPNKSEKHVSKAKDSNGEKTKSRN